MPNAFSPNGDGHNDDIYPIIYCNYIIEHFSVFNRWGQQVFTTPVYMAAWDGKFNGIDQPIGSYFYYITGHTETGKAISYKGDFTLVR